MRTSLAALDDTFDVVIVGGGVHGAFAALEASRRRLRVALVERGDFASGTSANSLRIAHGGLRYLGRADFRRMRESIRERAALMRLAPHLVRPLPCAMPVRSMVQRPFVAAALAANDLLTRLHPGDVHLPPARLLSRDQMDELADASWWGVDSPAAALWHDAIITSPERLIIMALRDAVASGATVRNYTEGTALLRSREGRVHGVAARADDTGGTAELRARVVLDAAGRASTSLTGRPTPCAWAVGWNLVTMRPAQKVAIAIPFPAERRMLFAVPWRGSMVLGTGYAPAGDHAEYAAPAAAHVSGFAELAESLLTAANQSRPGLAITMDDVALVQAGTLPMVAHSSRGVTLLDHPAIVHHERAGGAAGLVSVFGVKWTTARATAARAIDLCETLVRGGRPTSGGPAEPLCSRGSAGGGAHGRFEALYGPLAGEVEAIAAESAAMGEPLADGRNPLTGAQVAHAVRREGAVHLSDVLLRRTDAGTAGWPGDLVVERAAAIMASEAGWSDSRLEQERADVRRIFGRMA